MPVGIRQVLTDWEGLQVHFALVSHMQLFRL